MIAIPDGPKWTAWSVSNRRWKGQQCVVERGEMGLFCLTSSFTFTFTRRVRGTGLRGGVLTFPFAFSFSFASAFAFSFALGWCSYRTLQLFFHRKRGAPLLSARPSPQQLVSKHAVLSPP